MLNKGYWTIAGIYRGDGYRFAVNVVKILTFVAIRCDEMGMTLMIVY